MSTESELHPEGWRKVAVATPTRDIDVPAWRAPSAKPQVRVKNGSIACERDQATLQGGVAVATFRHPSPPLREWLASCRRRGVSMGLHDTDRITLTGPANDHDRAMADRYHHALTIAALGTHPAWWTHILHPDQPITATDLPTTPDHTPDGLAFRCGTCGQPADTLDAELVGWCQEHR